MVGWTDIDEGWAVVGGTEMRISCKPAGVIIVGPQDVVSVPQEDTIRRAFDELVEAWFEETMLSSSLREICSHWAYQRVIGMGSDVVPLILEDIGRGRRHWGWALTAITGENPAEDTDSPKAAAEAWLRWGRQRGLYAYDAKPMD
ncbi:MAG: hypothetical protein GY701_31665 [Sulfitobacter sp.]|nr:hypothetical protein [Sulfitobacter sp.]